jgi:hypothetical protein
MQLFISQDPTLLHHRPPVVYRACYDENEKATLLTLAVHGGHYALSEYLITQGLTLDIPAHSSVLFHAAPLPDDEGPPLIRLLHKHHARLKPTDAGTDGWLFGTPLHVAVDEDRTENARLLAELGSDLSAKDEHGKMALDYCDASSPMAKAVKEGAAIWQRREIVRRLSLISSLATDTPAPSPAVAEGKKKKKKSKEEVKEVKGKGNEKETKAAGWREIRQCNRKPLPSLEFLFLDGCMVGEEGQEKKGKKGKASGSKGKKKMAKKKEASLTETARLMYGVFVHIPSDVRRTVVSFV